MLDVYMHWVFCAIAGFIGSLSAGCGQCVRRGTRHNAIGSLVHVLVQVFHGCRTKMNTGSTGASGPGRGRPDWPASTPAPPGPAPREVRRVHSDDGCVWTRQRASGLAREYPGTTRSCGRGRCDACTAILSELHWSHASAPRISGHCGLHVMVTKSGMPFIWISFSAFWHRSL